MRKSEEKRTAFLNKFNVLAQYKINPSTQNMFNSMLEVLKGYYFWNTESKQNLQGRDGEFSGMIVIDPFAQNNANITLKTSKQIVRMQLPLKIRPFPLVSQKSEQSMHSLSQFWSRLSTQSRAECKIDGKRVQTFDNVFYKAPISTCYSILAKDCSGEQPQFAVLMKKLNRNNPDKVFLKIKKCRIF